MSAPDAPRVLRIALVDAGRVVDERLFDGDVTVGASETATFLLAGLGARRPFRLFVATADGFVLQLAAGMRGSLVQGGGAVCRLDELAAASSLRAPARLELSDDARGKVIVGEATLLFQLMARPPRRPRPQLPVAARKGLFGELDWLTTVVAAFSFLLHFFAVALVYSDWLDPVAEDAYLLGQLVEAATVLPAPPPLDPERGEAAVSSADAPAAAAPGKPTEGARPGGGHAGSPRSPGAASADARAADIVSELSQLEVGTLAALSGAGPATEGVLESSEVPAGLLDEAAQSEAGARRGDATGLLGLDGRGSDAVRPGETTDRRLASIGDSRARQGRDSATAAGTARPVAGPTGEATISGTGQTGGNVANAAQVVARMRGRFRACYQRGLDGHPEMQGSVTLLAKIGMSGEVLSVSGGGGALAPIVGCLRAVVQSGGFSPPIGGEGFVSITLHFRQIGF